MRLIPDFSMFLANIHSSLVLQDMVFTLFNSGRQVVYTHETHTYYSMPETVEHRNIRCKITNRNNQGDDAESLIDVTNEDVSGGEVNFVHIIKMINLIITFQSSKSIKASEFPHINRPPQVFPCEKTEIPSFLFCLMPKVVAPVPGLFCSSRRAAYDWKRHVEDWSWDSLNYHWSVSTNSEINFCKAKYFHPKPVSPVESITPAHGWSHISIPGKTKKKLFLF